jgi:hypothetical protein
MVKASPAARGDGLVEPLRSELRAQVDSAVGLFCTDAAAVTIGETNEDALRLTRNTAVAGA